MVQVDSFWAYGIGSGFALASAAASRTRVGNSPRSTALVSGSEAAAVLGYFSLCLVPAGLWLLWAFPSWETMHATDALPGWAVAAFGIVAPVLGLVGFRMTRWSLEQGRERVATGHLLGSYAGLFFLLIHGWDGTGYRRFLSATPDELAAWENRSSWHILKAWLGSDVAWTLIGMGVVVLSALLLVCAHWHAPGGGRAGWKCVGALVGAAIGGSAAWAMGASVLIHLTGWAIGGLLALGALAWLLKAPVGPASWVARAVAPHPGTAPAWTTGRGAETAVVPRGEGRNDG
ncbi:hypothetical protein ACFWIA_12585 [Streptomyces sp. NPDC127068]|uniref:hypothetical protein n=1 Tax=Streptomyces sp. NPDC127068 TaxID=3347127 RepID=UPI00365E0851